MLIDNNYPNNSKIGSYLAPKIASFWAPNWYPKPRESQPNPNPLPCPSRTRYPLFRCCDSRSWNNRVDYSPTVFNRVGSFLSRWSTRLSLVPVLLAQETFIYRNSKNALSFTVKSFYILYHYGQK